MQAASAGRGRGREDIVEQAASFEPRSRSSVGASAAGRSVRLRAVSERDRFADALRKAITIGVLRSAERVGKPGDWSWDEPGLVNGFRLPVPSGGLVFVAVVPSVVRARSPLSSLPARRNDVDFATFVQDALVDALVNGGADLGLGSNEWVTIIARMSSRRAVRGGRRGHDRQSPAPLPRA